MQLCNFKTNISKNGTINNLFSADFNRDHPFFDTLMGKNTINNIILLLKKHVLITIIE
jgi:hypothetical protein